MHIIILDCQNALRNYAFVIIDPQTNNCALIDTVYTPVIVDYLQKHDLNLKYILCTHHHNDHVGGNLALKEKYNCSIYGNYHDKHRISGITHTVTTGDMISLFDNQLQFSVIPLDGHTIGQIGFYEATRNWLFVGDTLFNMGCGRRFEGTAVQFHQSLERIIAFPENTMIYAPHEYTVDNIEFAKHIIPINYEYYTEFLDYCDNQANKRNQNLPTIPFDLASQKKFNPFLLCHLPIIKQSLQMDNSHNADVFGLMRNLKDNF